MHPQQVATMNSIGFEFPTHFNNNGFLDDIFSSQAFQSLHEYATQQPSGVSTNSTSDEAEDQHQVIDERKRRRMISNRESARRSRMRKQRQVDELWSQVIKLRTENHDLINKLKQASECHVRVLQENSKLKEDAAGLHEMITSLKLDSPYYVSRDLEEDTCNSTPLRTEEPSESEICICQLET